MRHSMMGALSLARQNLNSAAMHAKNEIELLLPQVKHRKWCKLRKNESSLCASNKSFALIENTPSASSLLHGRLPQFSYDLPFFMGFARGRQVGLPQRCAYSAWNSCYTAKKSPGATLEPQSRRVAYSQLFSLSPTNPTLSPATEIASKTCFNSPLQAQRDHRFPSHGLPMRGSLYSTELNGIKHALPSQLLSAFSSSLLNSHCSSHALSSSIFALSAGSSHVQPFSTCVKLSSALQATSSGTKRPNSSSTADQSGRYASKQEDAPRPLSEKYNAQFQKVLRIILQRQAFSRQIIEAQALTYYNDLGLPEYYFETTSTQTIANNLECVIAAKILAEASSEPDVFPVLHQDIEGEVFYLAKASIQNRKSSQNYAVEKELEAKYLALNGTGTPWRLQCFRSTGSVFDAPENFMERLRTYFLQRPQHEQSDEEISETEEDISKIADSFFYSRKKGTNTEKIYSRLNELVVKDDTGRMIFNNMLIRNSHCRIDLAFRRRAGTQDLFSRLGDCISSWGCFSQCKFVEPLANGVTIITAFIQELPKQELSFPDLSFPQRVNRLVKSVQMLFLIPQSRLSELAQERLLSIHEAAYCTSAAKFIQHFSSSVGSAFPSIEKFVTEFGGTTSRVSQQELHEVRTRLKIPLYSEDSVFRAIEDNCSIVKQLYKEFQEMHHPTPYHERGKVLAVWNEESPLKTSILTLDSPEAAAIFQMFRLFNKSILRTNFWKKEKICLGFRLDPSFLPTFDYPNTPHAVKFFVASEFVGFHVRFSEISRGGVRVVQSFTRQTYEQSQRAAFDEAYSLANTQNYKNKDIPEGGSKGVILLSRVEDALSAQKLTAASFMAYIDSMLDLLLPDAQIVDHLGRSEVCFLGPDENTGTGGLMDWAANHAKRRNAWFWKAFTTGKSSMMGGIPHDIYGMTTASVESYIQGILEKKQLKEEEVTKLLIGGPDGDLGSNSLLISNTKTTSVVDGSGVLHDPEGLNIEELRRLATRKFDGLKTSCMQYDEKLLSPAGFKVSQDTRNIMLPDGTQVVSGFQFRNEFHLSPFSSADLFNPCAGRPASINPFNFDRMFDKHGSLRFKYIVEGANVFITDDARRMLESRGCVLFKDASTNKGGVTSSSLEVLAALAMSDEEFDENMQVKDVANPPEFYQLYVQQILEKIKQNAKLEFDILWSEGERVNKPRCDLSDLLSAKIIKLKREIIQSDSLWRNEQLVDQVILKAIPSTLVPSLVSMDILRERVPEAYLKSLFASSLASRFFYSQRFCDELSTFAFFNFLNEISRSGKASEEKI